MNTNIKTKIKTTIQENKTNLSFIWIVIILSLVIFNIISNYQTKIKELEKPKMGDIITNNIIQAKHNIDTFQKQEEEFYKKYLEAKKNKELNKEKLECEKQNFEIYTNNLSSDKKEELLNCNNLPDKKKLSNKVVPKTEIIELKKTKPKFFLSGKKTTLQTPKKETKKETNPYLLKMNLAWCRITQGEKSHLKKGNGSMYAIDIACIRGKKFDVKAPKFKPYYILEKRWYDDKLWNYLVLRHWKNRYVFWHTTSSLEEGVKVVNNQIIGQTNISWISTNYHLHFELWEEDKNISWKNEVAPKSFKLIKQRKWEKLMGIKEIEVNPKNELDEIAKFIIKWEGFRNKAYCDNLIKQGNKWIKYCPTWKERFAIGYGTKSYKGEVISQKEGYRRLKETIMKNYKLVNNGCYTLNQKKAILSYMYNTGGNQMNLKSYIRKCSIKDIRYIMSVWGNKSSHKSRRNEEKKLLGE